MGQGLSWILDDGPLGHLAGIVDPQQVLKWKPGRLRAMSTTCDAARRLPKAWKTRVLLESTTSDGSLVVDEFSVLHGADDPAADILLELHPDMATTTNLAEREAIAWAQVQDNATVFVTADKRAALTALAELGRGRIAHPFDVWLDLLDLDWISGGQFDELVDLTCKHDQGLERMPGRVRARLSNQVPNYQTATKGNS